MTFVNGTKGLFSHEVGNHIGRTNEKGPDITQLGMVATEVPTHINVTCSWFVSRMKAHGNGATIITVQIGWCGVAET